VKISNNFFSFISSRNQYFPHIPYVASKKKRENSCIDQPLFRANLKADWLWLADRLCCAKRVLFFAISSSFESIWRKHVKILKNKFNKYFRSGKNIYASWWTFPSVEGFVFLTTIMFLLPAKMLHKNQNLTGGILSVREEMFSARWKLHTKQDIHLSRILIHL
jgi:hypothetical protein